MSLSSSTAQRLLYSSRTNSSSSLEALKSESFLRPESPTLLSEKHANGTSSEICSTYSGILNDFSVKENSFLHSNPTSIAVLSDVTNKSSLSNLDTQLEDKNYNLLRQKKSSKAAAKKQDQKMTDHQAAAIEINATNTITTPAPAAGMYWSRCLTYGRSPSRPIRAHTANLIGEKLYVFGGCDTSTCYNSLYILDMDTMTWSKPRLSDQYSPPPCRAHSCTVVEKEVAPGKKSSQLYIFGGGNGPDYFQDVYVFDIETLSWLKPMIDPLTRPPKRRAHTSCLWDDKLFIIGGGDGARALDDVYMLDTAVPSDEPMRWILVQTTGNAPPARGYHTSNLVKDKLVVFGGSDGHDCFEDVYVLDLPSKVWTRIDLDFKVPRLAHTSTQVGSYVFVIGGHDGRRYSQDILLFNLVTMSWEVRKVYGAPPSPRGYHTTILYDSRLYVIGGYDGKNVFDDVYMLELSACAYLPQITNFEIDL